MIQLSKKMKFDEIRPTGSSHICTYSWCCRVNSYQSCTNRVNVPRVMGSDSPGNFRSQKSAWFSHQKPSVSGGAFIRFSMRIPHGNWQSKLAKQTGFVSKWGSSPSIHGKLTVEKMNINGSPRKNLCIIDPISWDKSNCEVPGTAQRRASLAMIATGNSTVAQWLPL